MEFSLLILTALVLDIHVRLFDHLIKSLLVDMRSGLGMLSGYDAKFSQSLLL